MGKKKIDTEAGVPETKEMEKPAAKPLGTATTIPVIPRFRGICPNC